jgi:hypothetical protein
MHAFARGLLAWQRGRSALAALGLAAGVVLVAVGCEGGEIGTPTSPGASQAPTPSATAAPTIAVTAPPIPTGSIGPLPSLAAFAFDAGSVVGYYETQGYACTGERPSTQAAGYRFRTCTREDPNGRTLVVGVVTDAEGELADGFASVRGTDAEPILEPIVAFEPLAGFLGAMLGGPDGEALLPWLAGHLGDAYALAPIGELTIATYTASGDDHSTLYVEIANQAYLDAPEPSGKP